MFLKPNKVAGFGHLSTQKKGGEREERWCGFSVRTAERT